MSETAATARPAIVFVIGTMRSGSTWLGAVLGGHAETTCLGEYCRPFMQRGTCACRLCEADGRPECTVLYGIEHAAVADAYTFAAQRTQRSIIVDTSKRLDWLSRFVGQRDADVRLVHVLRHPAGYVDSQQRRRPGDTPDALLTEWTSANEALDAFTSSLRRPVSTVIYDELADAPEAHFPELCEALGFQWDPGALRYWERPQHGLGANGASSAYLRGRAVTNYRTGDDAFYATITQRPTTSDTRWRERIPEAFVRRAVRTPYVQALARRLGREPWR